MKPRKIKENVYWMGAADWDRRLFDALIPIPDGTSYNAYLIKGSEKTALLDTVEPTMTGVLMCQLEQVKDLDYIISHHAEQDHSGSIPAVLEKYRNAKVVTNPRCKEFLMDHLLIPEEKFITVGDGETLSLGNKTLKFLYTPWVHWPETMCTYLAEDKIIFTCDFFGAHLATTDLFVTNETHVYDNAKRYYAEIMMPFRSAIEKNLEKIKDLNIEMIAPSHGPIYDRPKMIMDAYRDWISPQPKNIALVPYISMHNSSKRMAECMVSALCERGITVHQFDLSSVDIGKLAIALVDAATIVIVAPAVLVGPHPAAAFAVFLTNALRPKLKFASIVSSYGWGGKVVEQITAMIPNLKVDMIPPILCKGAPKEADYKALVNLADTILKKHTECGLLTGSKPVQAKVK